MDYRLVMFVSSQSSDNLPIVIRYIYCNLSVYIEIEAILYNMLARKIKSLLR